MVVSGGKLLRKMTAMTEKRVALINLTCGWIWARCSQAHSFCPVYINPSSKRANSGLLTAQVDLAHDPLKRLRQ